ncbi:hypothetical protein GCM10011383_44830 [Hymenobacter cavernae]|uniref:Uncharacterized protein n=1 Tax=Hymenobacter cavernae TaxID=2044852 RepID=A0ABQ1UVF9_9BACT|nr:hypothetical protein GCM10011383_44830 [Hymenobacter cavernae]
MLGGGERARPAVDEAARAQGALVGQAQQRPGVEAQLVAFGGVQGLRAAAPCLACKERYDDQQMIRWDPVKMRLGKTPRQPGTLYPETPV